MKVTFNVECTPEEARQFLGLPNVAAMQDRMMEDLEARMRENLQTLDPETFVKTWLPATIQGWGDMQKVFWGQMAGAGMNPAASDAPAGKSKSK